MCLTQEEVFRIHQRNENRKKYECQVRTLVEKKGLIAAVDELTDEAAKTSAIIVLIVEFACIACIGVTYLVLDWALTLPWK